MSYKDRAILTDKDGKPIPQIWSDALNDYIPYDGKTTIDNKANNPVPTSGTSKVTNTDLEPVPVLVVKQGKPIDVNISAVPKGLVTTVINDKSASFESTEFESSGYNALDLYVTITGTAIFTVKVKGSQVSGGTFTERYDAGVFNATKVITIPQVSDYYKIEVTLKSGVGKCSVDVQPCNVFGNPQRPTYKEYILAINETVGANLESSVLTVYNTEWVRGIKLLVKSPTVGYQPIYRDIASNGDISGGNNLGSSQPLANFWRSTSLNPSNFVPSSYGMQFSVKNADAGVAGLIQAHIILVGV